MAKNVVFNFDPFLVVIYCFKRMFPRKKALVEWDDNLHASDTAWGKTDILTDSIASVSLDTSQSITGAVDTLIHELSHVGRGVPRGKNVKFMACGGHDARWDVIYKSLWREYEKHRLTHLFQLKIGIPKDVSNGELHDLLSKIVDKSFQNQIRRKSRRKRDAHKTNAR